MREGRFFLSARTRARMTQVEVAEKLGYENGQFISNIERGLCYLPNDRVRDFCAITGASLLGYVRLKVTAQSREIRREILG